MLKQYNAYVSHLLALSKLYRDNPSSADYFTKQEIQFIHKWAVAFDEMLYNVRMSAVNKKLASLSQQKKPRLSESNF